jgi:hypothetical protein
VDQAAADLLQAESERLELRIRALREQMDHPQIAAVVAVVAVALEALE